MRGELAKANKDTLDELFDYATSLTVVTPTVGTFSGQSIPVKLTKVRILDIVLWTELAIHFENHPGWSRWYADE